MRAVEDRKGNHKIVDDDGDVVAYNIKGEWTDPYGGVFSKAQRDEFDDMVVRQEASELGESNIFGRYMGDILVEERQRTRRAARPVERDSVGQRRAALIADSPANRTRVRGR